MQTTKQRQSIYIYTQCTLISPTRDTDHTDIRMYWCDNVTTL